MAKKKKIWIRFLFPNFKNDNRKTKCESNIKDHLKITQGAPCWLSALTIQYCHYHSAGSVPGLGTSACCGHNQKQTNKQTKQTKTTLNFKKITAVPLLFSLPE